MAKADKINTPQISNESNTKKINKQEMMNIYKDNPNLSAKKGHTHMKELSKQKKDGPIANRVCSVDLDNIPEPKKAYRVDDNNKHSSNNLLASNLSESEDVDYRTVTATDFENNTFTRLDEWDRAKRSKIEKMRLDKEKQYNVENKHMPEINENSEL